jgi:NDP-sugar pyrophosphorylase family protein
LEKYTKETDFFHSNVIRMISMATKISPMSQVDPAARIGDGVEIGPFCVVGPGVTLGDGTKSQKSCRDHWSHDSRRQQLLLAKFCDRWRSAGRQLAGFRDRNRDR